MASWNVTHVNTTRIHITFYALSLFSNERFTRQVPRTASIVHNYNAMVSRLCVWDLVQRWYQRRTKCFSREEQRHSNVNAHNPVIFVYSRNVTTAWCQQDGLTFTSWISRTASRTSPVTANELQAFDNILMRAKAKSLGAVKFEIQFGRISFHMHHIMLNGSAIDTMKHIEK